MKYEIITPKANPQPNPLPPVSKEQSITQKAESWTNDHFRYVTSSNFGNVIKTIVNTKATKKFKQI